MSCALFLFLTLADDYACFSLFYCIFVLGSYEKSVIYWN